MTDSPSLRITSSAALRARQLLAPAQSLILNAPWSQSLVIESLLSGGRLKANPGIRQITSESVKATNADTEAEKAFLQTLKTSLERSDKLYVCPFDGAKNSHCVDVRLSYIDMIVHLTKSHSSTFGFTMASMSTTLRVSRRRDVLECDACKLRLGDTVSALEHVRHHTINTPPYACRVCKGQLYAFQFDEHAKVL